MSEYCYQCQGCGQFKEYCKCPEFDDPMAQFRDMSDLELMESMEERY